jgi:hypothetical protein
MNANASQSRYEYMKNIPRQKQRAKYYYEKNNTGNSTGYERFHKD